jgi:hypothetical protein
VWQSREDYERWTGEHLGPVMGALAAAGWTLPEPLITEFTPLGIVVPVPRSTSELRRLRLRYDTEEPDEMPSGHWSVLRNGGEAAAVAV